MTIMSDHEIAERCGYHVCTDTSSPHYHTLTPGGRNGALHFPRPMIDSFIPTQVRAHRLVGLSTGIAEHDHVMPCDPADPAGKAVISYGLSSAGYDIRCVPEWREFKRYGRVSPQSHTNFATVDPKAFNMDECTELLTRPVYTLPPGGYVLTASVERFVMPRDVVGICVGKSTYARCGVIVNVTPLEPGWEGTLVIEIANATPLPVKLYAGEGIAQIVFHRIRAPTVSYADRGGKYQGQTGITPAKV